MRIILGLILIAIGAFIAIRNEWFTQTIGRLRWAEKFFSTTGGSRIGWLIIGLAIAVVGLIIATNLIAGIVLFIYGNYFPQ